MRLSEELQEQADAFDGHEDILGSVMRDLLNSQAEKARRMEARIEELENTLDLIDPECDRYNIEEDE